MTSSSCKSGIEFFDVAAEPTLRARGTLPALSPSRVVMNPAHGNDGKRILRVDLHAAIQQSRIGSMHGLPFPVQFRREGALDAWRKALCATPDGVAIWQGWAKAERTSYEIRQEILAYLHNYRNYADTDPQAHTWQTVAKHWSQACSTNLLFELHKGTVIEATPALETLLAHSDIDLALPMSMVVPPFAAQYVRFGPEASKLLPLLMPEQPDVAFDGVFCFLSTPPKDAAGNVRGGWLELIFIVKVCGRFEGQVSLSGSIDSGYVTFNDWFRDCMAHSGVGLRSRPEVMSSFVSYVVKIFLYLTLKDARRVSHAEFSEMQHRAKCVGPKKKARLAKKLAALYDGIVVGPAALPSAVRSATPSAHAVAPHWRRGHFRMQPHGQGRQLRKLIFVAPLLVHADRLGEEIPSPRAYTASL